QLFVHISAMRGDSRPQVGDTVLYIAGSDAQGRPRAQHMRHAGLALDRPAIRRKPVESAKPRKASAGPVTRQSRAARPAQPGVRNLPIKLLVLVVLCILPA